MHHYNRDFITHFRLGNMFFSNMFYKVNICDFVKKCNKSSFDEQKYILQLILMFMSSLNMKASNNFIKTFVN